MNGLLKYRLEVASALTPEFLRGGAKPPLSEYQIETVDESLERYGEVDVELVRQLIAHALEELFPDSDSGEQVGPLDAWLAKRLHYSVRVPRRVACDKRFWAYLAIEAGSRYVVRRWWELNPLRREKGSSWHFTGDVLRNGLSRLWWGAELVRNGQDYELVDALFARVRTAQFALELKYSWLKPAAIGFVRVAEGLDGGARLSDSETERLSVRANSYLSLGSLEEIAWDDSSAEMDGDWWSRGLSLRDVLRPDDVKGPADGTVSSEAIDAATRWFRGLTA